MELRTQSQYKVDSNGLFELLAGPPTWDIRRSNYTDESGSVNNLQGIDISLDGETLWVCSRDDEKVFEYGMDPWDITSVSEPADAEFDFSDDFPQNYDSSVAHGVQIRRTGGDYLFIFNRQEIFGYELETPYDITSATQGDFDVLDLSANVDRGHDFDFDPDGTELFIDDRLEEDLHQYSLSTAWDITTASHTHTHDISSFGSQGWQGMEVGDGGHKLWVVERGDDEMHQFTMSESYDLTTVKRDTAIETPHGGTLSSIVWRPDGEQFFISEYTDHEIHEYNLGPF